MRYLLSFQKHLTYRNLFAVYIVITIAATIPKLFLEKYNNYLIFINSFDLLRNHQNPFLAHPELYYDLFRYTPTFAVLVSPFSLLPISIGVIVWNLLNSLLLFSAIKFLFKEDEKKGSLILLSIIPELLTCIQNIQVNALVTGIILFSYACFIYKKEALAAFLCILNLFIKIYGFAAALLFVLAKNKKKIIQTSTITFFGFLILPLLFVSVPELKSLYQTEFSSIAAYSVPFSFMGVINAWFGVKVNDLAIQIPALLILCAPAIFGFFQTDEIKLKLQRLLVCSVLTFLCAFNQMAESATYIVAVTGAVLWYFTSNKSKLNDILFIVLIIFCELAPTDIIPRFVREHFFEPYKIKAVPVILIWFKIQYDTWVLIIRNKLHRITNPSTY